MAWLQVWIERGMRFEERIDKYSALLKWVGNRGSGAQVQMLRREPLP